MLRWLFIKFWLINQFVFDVYNTQPNFLKDKNDLCSCYVYRANVIQCKHDICVNQNFDISKIGKCWQKRKNISQSSYKVNYNSPTMIKYNSMVSDIPNDEMFLHSEINNNNSTLHNNELMKVNDVNISN